MIPLLTVLAIFVSNPSRTSDSIEKAETSIRVDFDDQDVKITVDYRIKIKWIGRRSGTTTRKFSKDLFTDGFRRHLEEVKVYHGPDFSVRFVDKYQNCDQLRFYDFTDAGDLDDLELDAVFCSGEDLLLDLHQYDIKGKKGSMKFKIGMDLHR